MSSQQETIFSRPINRMLCPFTSVARWTKQLNVFHIVAAAKNERHDMIAMIICSEFNPTGGIGTSSPLGFQQERDILVGVFSNSPETSGASIGDNGSCFFWIVGSPFLFNGLASLWIVFNPQGDACRCDFRMLFIPFSHPCNIRFLVFHICSSRVHISARNTYFCRCISFAYVSVNACFPSEISSFTREFSLFPSDNFFVMRQNRYSHSGSPIARKVRGMAALKRRHVSALYVNEFIFATGLE